MEYSSRELEDIAREGELVHMTPVEAWEETCERMCERDIAHIQLQLHNDISQLEELIKEEQVDFAEIEDAEFGVMYADNLTSLLIEADIQKCIEMLRYDAEFTIKAIKKMRDNRIKLANRYLQE